MNADDLHAPETMRPLQVAMVFLVSAVLAGGFVLLSAAESATPVDGAVEWDAESPLRAVVQLLCLGYRFPTLNAGEVKGYLLGIGAGVALFALSVAGLVRPRTAEAAVGDQGAAADAVEPVPDRGRVSPLTAAQVLAVLYVLWSFASSRWSPAPQLSIGGSVLLAIALSWSLAIGVGLGPSGARLAARILVLVTGLTAAVGLWYYYGRNPTLRAKFPFGNPTFLAAAMLPGSLLAAANIVENLVSVFRTGPGRHVAEALVSVIILSLCLWTLDLADSRGAQVGLGVGAAVMLVLALPGRWKWVAGVVGAAAAAGALWYFLAFMDAPSSTGRGATLRLRTYAWGYAWRMVTERPLAGHGQGAYTMLADSYVADDVLRDPPVFESRIDHAHCEWLEVMADLGAVGVLLIVVSLLFTAQAALPGAGRFAPPAGRGVTIGLLGALAALAVEECFGVGLRVCEVPLVFYTVVGLLWAVAGRSPGALRCWVEDNPGRRTLLGVAGLLLSAGALVLTQHDFQAARQAQHTDEQLQRGDYDAATRTAMLATHRLYPQRVLLNLYRLAQTHVLAAERLHGRAADRERRSEESQPPNPNLRLLAAEDYAAADEHCRAASNALKDLVSAAPRFINHGLLEFKINVLQGRGAASRGDSAAANAYLRNAAAAIEREIARQPFDPALAVDFLRLAGSALDGAVAMTVLARPLRYHRITDTYVSFLDDALRVSEFDAAFQRSVNDAGNALLSPAPDAPADESAARWAPETLRLGATVDFLEGRYDLAVRKLEIASLAYERMVDDAALGAASAYAELADCRFYSDPDHPAPAIDSAQRAIEVAPESRPGRELRTTVRQRLIHYQLAAGNEAEARRVLEQLAPPHIQPEIVQRELGLRLRRLCESLLQRRETENLRKSAETLLPKLEGWLRRASELNPEDPASFFLAADLAFYRGDESEAANRLGHALELGLPREDARRFLETALSKRPESEPLRKLLQALSEATSDAPRSLP